MAYHDNNKRELELTRHVSLRQLDPLALLTLRITGSCTVTVPEWLYDRDCPGHYMRRIKSVGAVDSVGGRALYQHQLHVEPAAQHGARLAAAGQRRLCPRARPRTTTASSIISAATDVIVTSGGSNDSGMFETNLRDDRFLPFEGAGADQHLDIVAAGEAAGVRLHDDLRRDPAHPLHRARGRRPAGLAGDQGIDPDAGPGRDQSPQALMFCLRYDFPTEWAAFVNDPTAMANLAIALTPNDFPYMAQAAKTLTIDSFALYAANPNSPNSVLPDGPQPAQMVNGAALPFSFSSANPTANLSLPADTLLVRQQTRQVFLLVQYHFA